MRGRSAANEHVKARPSAARPPRVVGRAHAKVNLDLRVVGLLPDGYHDVRTVLQSLRLHDTLTFTPARGRFVIECADPTIPTGDSNLIWRAAERVWKAAGRRGAPRDVSIQLTKRIPLQAGLGGGSSDAAAALRAFGAAGGWPRPPRLPVDADRAQTLVDALTSLGLDRSEQLR